MRSAIQDGLRPSPENEELVSAEQSDEEEKYAEAISRVMNHSKSYTYEEEKAIICKFDRRLVLFMALLYMLSFLDRSSQTFNIY
jgi:hypothetical protein